MTTPLLSISNLSIEFVNRQSTVRVVDEVGFDLPKGESVGLVGESGSGKSLTALSLLRLIEMPPARIASGTAFFKGRDLLSMPAAELRKTRGRDIGMIFQEPMSALNPIMKVGEQISEVLLLHTDLSQRERKNRVIELLQSVGIEDAKGRLNSFPHEFSGGMRQRVMIAMAMACDPELLIADEPTTALDVTVQAQVMDLMADIRDQKGTSILLISHDLGVIADICSQLVVMYAGRIVEAGPAGPIFSAPQHPYTQGLMASIPRLDGAERRLFQIPGNVPAPGSIRKGCVFAPRCAHATSHCRSERPPSFDLGGGHIAACWLAENTLAVAESTEARQ